MKSIWKFPIEITDEQKIALPITGKIISVQVQHGTPCIWAMVDTEEPTSERTFIIHGTGHPCICDASEFIGTFQVSCGDLVFHLFEKKGQK
jgi:hypothetical protein